MEKECSKCHTSNPQEAKFCRHCGNKFEDVHNEDNQKVKKKSSKKDTSKSSKAPILLGILSATVLVLIHFFEIPIRYNLHFGYSEWLSISKITNIVCWILLAACAVWLTLSSARNFNKEKSMKQHSHILLALTILAFSSCNRQSSDVVYKIDYLYCETEDDEDPGFIDAQGNFYKLQTRRSVYPVVHGYGLINGNLYRVGKDVSDTTLIANDIEVAGVMNDGLIPICKEGGFVTVIDSEGEEVFQLKEFEEKEVLGAFSYSDSKLRVVLEDGSFVFVDKKGRQLFGTRYSWATDFQNGHAIVQKVSQNSHLFSFIDENATPIFTFESDEKEDITISYDMELISAAENDKCIIYDFSGKRILECPSKVYRIYSFCQNGFIYCDDDDKYGLMSYNGEHLIRAKYEQLVPNGQYYLALNDDEEIKLIDKSDRIIKEYEGREILDFQRAGYEFPNAIRVELGHYMILDEEGNVVCDDIDIELKNEQIQYIGVARSDYFPQQQVLDIVMELCGKGKEISDKYGAFLYRNGTRCFPRDISFVSSFSIQSLQGNNWARTRVENGVNYEINYAVVFDEPIVRKGESTLSSSAWLKRVELHIWMPNIFRNQVFLNACVQELKNNGCTVYHSKKTDYILLSSNKELMYVVYHNWDNREYEFRILMMPNTDDNRNAWTTFINNSK